jgi:hypothetical protein
MNDNTKAVPVDELTLIFGAVEDLTIIVEELTTGYFDGGNTETKDGQRAILWDFKRARAKTNAVLRLASSAREQLQKLGASR